MVFSNFRGRVRPLAVVVGIGLLGCNNHKLPAIADDVKLRGTASEDNSGTTYMLCDRGFSVKYMDFKVTFNPFFKEERVYDEFDSKDLVKICKVDSCFDSEPEDCEIYVGRHRGDNLDEIYSAWLE